MSSVSGKGAARSEEKSNLAGARPRENEGTTAACTPRTPDEKLRKILGPLENKSKSPGRSPLRQRLVVRLDVN